MKITLMIEGSASALAAILASLPADAAVSVSGAAPAPALIPMPANLADDDDSNEPVNLAPPALDSVGMPWDERIHSEKRGVNGDGSWRKRRGVSKETIAAVEAELRARAAVPMPVPAPAPVAMPTPAPAPLAPVPAPAPVMMPDPAAAPIPMPVPAATAFPAPVAAPAYEAPAPLAAVAPAINAAVAQTPAIGLDFAQFMQHLSGQMTARDATGAPLIHADYLAAITAEISGAFQQPLNAITDIAQNPAMINFAVQAMQRDGRW